MTFWLVTRSEHYYPCGGTEDWVCLTADEDEARYEFTEADARDGSVYLIRISRSEDGSVGYGTVDCR